MRTQFVLAHSWLVAGGFCALALSSSLPAQTNGTSFPTVTIYASDPRAAEAGPDEGTFTVARTGSTNFALLVFYQLGGTASNGVDYEKLANTVSIPAGASNAQITVKPIDDDLVEGLETVVAQITGSPLACATCGYFIGYPSNAVVTIADNDGPASTNHPPEVKIALPSDGATFIAPANILLSALAADVDGFVATVEFFEGTHSLGVTTNNPEIVGFGGGPVNPFMLTWTNVPAGAYTLTAKATDDQGAMATSAPVKITVSQEQQTVVNIEATDPDATEIPIVSPCLDIAQRFDPAVFTVTRAGNANIDLMVFYTVGGTASNGVDYLKLPGVVTIPAGALSATIEIFPLVDSLLEGTETVVVALQAPMCIAIFPPPPGCYLVGQESLATAFIHDFPPPPVVTIVASDPDASETGPDPGTFTVSRTGATNDPLTVFYFTRGTALNGLDYRALFDYVVIPAGASSADVTVLPIDDELVEGPETVVVQLGILFPCGTLWETNVVIDPLFYFPAPYWVGYPSNALVTIADNDTSGANLPPDARIVTPPDGAVFVGPTNILLGADAFDRDGSVAQVEFFEGNNSLGLARGPLRTPFGTWLLIWSNAALGEYTLTAKATDNLGAMGVSAPVHLRVVSTPPPPPTNLPPLVS
ncbi:MAG TPA: Calx-beta domain-containing protein, partial [Candidatus Binatia bacterium]|nr:Calx-beta domain-containing protein [Candidatus Binatia bacterium]